MAEQVGKSTCCQAWLHEFKPQAHMMEAKNQPLWPPHIHCGTCMHTCIHTHANTLKVHMSERLVSSWCPCLQSLPASWSGSLRAGLEGDTCFWFLPDLSASRSTKLSRRTSCAKSSTQHQRVLTRSISHAFLCYDRLCPQNCGSKYTPPLWHFCQVFCQGNKLINACMFTLQML